jgi:hypothetical protein
MLLCAHLLCDLQYDVYPESQGTEEIERNDNYAALDAWLFILSDQHCWPSKALLAAVCETVASL